MGLTSKTQADKVTENLSATSTIIPVTSKYIPNTSKNFHTRKSGLSIKGIWFITARK